VSCLCDTIDVCTHNQDNFIQEEICKNSSRSEVKITNRNWIQNADIEVTFSGRRKYQTTWSNTLLEFENKISSQTNTISFCENILNEFKEVLASHQRVLSENSTPIANIEKRLAEYKTILEKLKEKEKLLEKRFTSVKKQYFLLVLEHVDGIKNSTLYEREMKVSNPDTYAAFCKAFDNLAPYFTSELAVAKKVRLTGK